jgi:hypothetical protein
MSKFDEMIGLPEQIQLGRRPLITLGETEGEVEDMDEEEKSTPEAVTYHGQRAKENKFGDSGDSFISKLLSSKYGEGIGQATDTAANRSKKPYQSDSD